jgi:hypothetical protein
MQRLRSAELVAATITFLVAINAPTHAQERDQDLDVVFLRWTPGASPLAIDPVFAGEPALSSDEQQRLGDVLEGGGTVVVSAVCSTGDATEGRQRMVIVLRGPINPEKPVNLRTFGPRDRDAIIVQGSHPKAWWWARPDLGSNFGQMVHLRADEKDPLRTLYTVDLASGGTKTGVAYIWDKRRWESWLQMPEDSPR